VGKFTTAREFAKLLLCKNPVERGDFNDSCGNCASCRCFEAGSHPDFDHIYKELIKFTKEGKDKEKPVDFPIDVVREFLIEKVSLKPALSTRRIFILTEAEKLNNQSQNCLLKVLEEPPSYCCIILICTRPEKLLPTIRSRCQILRFGPVAEDRIIEKLSESGLGEKQARYFSRLADGSVGQALAWSRLEQNGANLFQTKTELIKAVAELEYKNSLTLAEDFQQQSKDLAAVWVKLEPAVSVNIVIASLHDAMLTKITPTAPIINFDQPEEIKSIARRFDAEQAAGKITDCFKFLHFIDSSVNEKLIFESLLLNLAESGKIGVAL
jgi:DNA polymerase-3 subunit delta'